MTDKEIVKALECCSCAENILVRGKTYKAKPLCDLFKDALDLINRLKAKNKEFDEKIIMQKGLIDSQKAEIERLQKIIVGFMDEVGTWSNKYEVDVSTIYKLPFLAKEDFNIRNKIKSEGRLELAERLKQRMFAEDFLLCEPCDMADIIDNLVKEMVGD